jgi:hypothetical protein
MAKQIPVFVRIGHNPAHLVGYAVVEDGQYAGRGPRQVANLLREVAAGIDNGADVLETSDVDDGSELPLSRRRTNEWGPEEGSRAT